MGIPWALCSSSGTDLEVNQVVIGYAHNSSCQCCTSSYILASQFCSMQDPALGKIMGEFSPPVVCIAPSSTMKARQQEDSFLLNS